MSDKLTVDLLYPYTDRDGNNHNANKSASLPVEEATELIYLGRAKASDSKAKAASAGGSK